MLDWRRALIYTHRWLGIAGSIVFLVWFVSGVVMMYARMPRLTAEERLVRLAPVDLSRLAVEPIDAAQSAGVTPDRMRVGSVDGRPIYRFLSQGTWKTVFADTGEPLRGLQPGDATRIVRRFFPEHRDTIRYASRLDEPDQWTIDGGLPRFLPLHRVSLGDDAGTFIYVSDLTGEPVMKTDARGRFWGYMGAVLHWTYFTPFRLQPGLWRYSIIYAGLIGCVMCLTGLAVGIWRYSLSRRYRLKSVHSRSPYAGLMWWHHYAGLVFGLASFTWALSGALSLTPWDWSPSTAPSAAQVDAVSGGPFRLDAVSVPRIREAAAVLTRDFPAKEFDVLQFRGEPVLMAYRLPSWSEAASWTNPDLRAIYSVQLGREHRLVRLASPDRGTFTRFDDDAVLTAARAAMPGVAVTRADWLQEYDAYYYDRRGMKPLPVLRIQFADPQRTWLYVDPQHGLISLKHERLTRVNRWLYHGLHSFDFPVFYYSRPLWDVVLVLLSIGGIALSVTTMLPAWRRLRRNARGYSKVTIGRRMRSRINLSTQAARERS
jgi:hypothetical protein